MANSRKVTFRNKEGDLLSGILELPIHQAPHNFALFAHCFTCSKNLRAVVHISRELTQAGFGVLRFDFTGLGESGGAFEDTNFSGNVEDLRVAARFLEEHYQAPALLVGHSLGGAAILYAASGLPYVKAVATIGAPAEPAHVRRLLKEKEEEILLYGKATVQLEGRPFTIKKQFLDDLRNTYLPDVVRKLRKALIIFHSPQDQIVEIKNAEILYKNARHPKSFISLDGADHLLKNDEDARYTGKVMGQWASRYVEIPEENDLQSDSRIAASLDGPDGYSTKLKLGRHALMGDEPKAAGGNDYGPNPYDLLTAGLAACKVMTVQMYARRKGWEVDNVTVSIQHGKEYAKDCETCEQNPSARIDVFNCELSLTGNLDEKQRKRLLEIADRCPVHRTLTNEVQIKSRLISSN